MRSTRPSTSKARITARTGGDAVPRLIGALAMMGLAGTAVAVESIGIEAGTGDHVNVVGVDVGFGEWRRGSFGGGWSWSLYGKLGVAQWEGRDDGTAHKHVTDFSAYPVLRLDRDVAATCSPYLEAAIGAHLLSRTRINDRQLSTAFQFGEFAGAGCTFGETRQFDLGVRLQHVSNGGIKEPNCGLTYVSIAFRYRFGGR